MMTKKKLEILRELKVINSNNIPSPEHQNIIDNFLRESEKLLKKSGFIHYNADLIKEKLAGKYYKTSGHYLIVTHGKLKENNEASLNIFSLASKIIKEVLNVSLVEGFKLVTNYHKYLGYYLDHLVIEVKQNKSIAYLKFDLFNVFLFLFYPDLYLPSSLLDCYYLIICKPQLTEVNAYGKKIRELFNKNVIFENKLEAVEVKKEKLRKLGVKLPLLVSTNDYKNQTIFSYVNDEKKVYKLDEINNYYLDLTKSDNNLKLLTLKNCYEYEKEVFKPKKGVFKINICNDCLKKEKLVMVPFNRNSKVNSCSYCNLSNEFCYIIKK